jgi:hypothetical protein
MQLQQHRNSALKVSGELKTDRPSDPTEVLMASRGAGSTDCQEALDTTAAVIEKSIESPPYHPHNYPRLIQLLCFADTGFFLQ